MKRRVWSTVLVAALVLATRPALGQSAGTMARMQLNLRALGVDALEQATGADGRDVLIAIIDTGIDPAHPALSVTPDGRPKVIDWVDFTGRGGFAQRAAGAPGSTAAEGDVVLSPAAATPNMDALVTPLGMLRLGEVRSLSGVYAVGAFEERQLGATAFGDGDLNGDGTSNTVYAVVAIDTREPGVYDTVIVDADADLDLRDEVPLEPYRLSYAVAAFRRAGDEAGHANFVVTDLAPDGTLVNLGFDGNGHGTHVASVAAGYHAGVYRGVAPGAQLLALKALSSEGEGAWSQIAAAVDYAVQAGADVISISVDALAQPPGADGVEGGFLERAARDCACLIVVAAGNEGPGIGSGSTPGSAAWVFSVGAYYTPEMIQWDYGYRPAAAGVWSFSGTGPRADGSLLPNVVAPGSAMGAVPAWQSRDLYQVYEGTSVAVPQVAGVGALLLDASSRAGRPASGAQLRLALERGARPLGAYTPLSQGYGAVAAADAWRALLSSRGSLSVQAAPDLPAEGGMAGGPGGLFSRSGAPGRVSWRVRNGGAPLDLTVVPGVDWLLPDRRLLRAAPGTERLLSVDFALPEVPGLYTGWLQLQGAGRRVDLLQTVIQPDRSLRSGRPVTRSGVVSPGTWRRVFVEVPPGLADLTAVLRLPGAAASGPTAARLMVYRPDGSRWWTGDLLGTHPLARGREQTLRVPLPEPGIWEFIVEAPFLRGARDLAPAGYELRVTGTGVTWSHDSLWVTFDAQARTASRTLNLKRVGSDARVEVVALGPSSTPPVITVFRERVSTVRPAYREVRVPPGTGLLEVTASSTGAADVNLFLYRKGAAGTPEEIGRSAGPDTASEVVRIWFPQPGTYVIWAEAASPSPVPVQLTVRALPSGSPGIQVGTTAAADQRVPSWTVTATVPRPTGNGHFFATLAVEDTTRGYLLGVVPILIETGRPVTRISVQAAPAVQTGRNWVTVTVLDAVSLRPVPAQIWIDGRPYAAPHGRLLLRRPLGPAQQRVEVRALAPGFARQEALVRIGSPPVPFGGGELPREIPALHRKLAEQWAR